MDKTTAKVTLWEDAVALYAAFVREGFVCVFPKLEHLPTMQFDHQQFSLSFLCAVFLAANVASGREKQTTEVLHAFLTRSAGSQVWHVLFAVA